MLFGAVAVLIRVGVRGGVHPETASVVSVAAAFASSLVVSIPWLHEVGRHGAWPFLVAGLIVPGLSQVCFVRSIDAIGASRATILIGISPLLSALFAITLLGEPVRAGLVAGTVCVVGGGLLLGWERSWPFRERALGLTLGALAALFIAVRDNLVRWAATGNAVPGVVAATASLAAGTALIAVAAGPGAWRRDRLRSGLTASLVGAGLLFGLAYDAIFVAFDHGRVTVVAPLYATESLWAVLFAGLLLQRVEALTLQVLAAGLLVVAGGVLIGVSR